MLFYILGTFSSNLFAILISDRIASGSTFVIFIFSSGIVAHSIIDWSSRTTQVYRDIILILAFIILMLFSVNLLTPGEDYLSQLGGVLSGMCLGFVMIQPQRVNIFHSICKTLATFIFISFANIGIVCFYLFRTPILIIK